MSDAALVRWRWGTLAALLVLAAGDLWMTVADLERWWDRGPVLRAIGLGATAVLLVALGFFVGGWVMLRWTDRLFRR